MFNRGDILQEYFGTRDVDEAYEKFNVGLGKGPRSSTLVLPYSVPTSELPAPIPTAQELMDQCVKGNKLNRPARYIYGAQTVFKVNGYAVKISYTHGLQQEAENLIFVQQNTTIKVPKVYAVFTMENFTFSDRVRPTPKCYFMVMEFFEGTHMTKRVWDSLSPEGKTKVGTELGQMLEKLQSIPSSGYYGRVHHQGFPSDLDGFRDNHPERELGPYDSYEEFIEAFYKGCLIHASLSSFEPDHANELWPRAQVDLFCMKKAFLSCNGQESRLTKENTHYDSIFLRPITPKGEIEGTDFEVIFLDWQHTAWLPAWAQSLELPDMGFELHRQEYGVREGAQFYRDTVKAFPSFRYVEKIWISKFLASFNFSLSWF